MRKIDDAVADFFTIFAAESFDLVFLSDAPLSPSFFFAFLEFPQFECPQRGREENLTQLQ